MLKFLSVLLLDVAIGAALPPIQTNPDQSQFQRLTASSPHLHSPLPQTHIRITRPPLDHKHLIDANLVASQSSHNIQFASSPTSDYYGGSVYSDGNGILVRPQADDISYQRFHQPEISYFPSYQPDKIRHPYPYAQPAYHQYEPRLSSGSGLHYYVTQPVQSRDVLMHGLGRVLPVNRNLRKPQAEISTNDHDNDVLMFTLGRIMGQLNNINNETKMGPFLEYALGLQQPQEKPIYPWGNDWPPPPSVLQSMFFGQTQTRPNMWANPTWTNIHPTLPYPSTPRWWQPSYTPWQPDRPWWANIFEQEQEEPKPWWYKLLQTFADSPADNVPP